MAVLTVLVVDDSELHQRVVRTCLERAGHRVMTAMSASDAADMLAAATPAVIIISAALAREERRLALAAALESRAARPPVVLLAAGPGDKDGIPPATLRRLTGVVARPYERDRLAAHVELYSMGAAPAKILVVDDSPTLRHANVATLKAAGHEVVEASHGKEALAVLDSVPGIDMVLSDVVMPEMDGYQLVAAIRARADKALVPVVMLTSLDDVGSQSRAIETGADDVLQKPIQPAELRARVRAILRLKTLQQKLVARNEELAHAMQLREDLTTTVIHDFKNPLSVVMGCGDMIAFAAQERGQDDIFEMANDVVNASIRLKNFTETLLEVARLEVDAAKPRPTVFAVHEVTRAICTDIGRLALRAGVELVAKAPPEVKVRADREWVYRVLQNLVDNALKYAPMSSQVTLEASIESTHWVKLAVSDQGPGIPPEHRQRIFDRFAQLKNAERRGTGLGLAFCRMAVEAHGGQIRVADSPADQPGAIFELTLPAAT